MNRLNRSEMHAFAQSGVTKVDLLGHRGTTLVTCEEVAAMAVVIALRRQSSKIQRRSAMADETEALDNAVESVEEALNMLEQVPDDHHRYGAALDDAFDKLVGVRDLLKTVVSNVTDGESA